MKIIRRSFSELSITDKNEIDQFIDLHNGLVFHETRFNEIASQIYKTSFFYFIAYANNEIAGICPAHKINKGILKLLFSNLSSREIPYGGWIYNKKRTSLKSLMDNTKINFNECLIYSSGIQKDNNDYEKIGISNITKMNTLILDLSPSIDDLFNVCIIAKQRNKIRRAQKLGITIEKIPFANMDEFIDLSSELKEKVGISLKPSEFYKKVMEIYAKEDKAVCLAAKYENRYISSMILVANKNAAIAWVAGRKADLPNNLYQNELLWWESIIWAKEFGSKYLDLCGLDELKLPHLARIKMSFSKEIVPFFCFSKKSLFFRIVYRMQSVFSNIR